MSVRPDLGVAVADVENHQREAAALRLNRLVQLGRHLQLDQCQRSGAAAALVDRRQRRGRLQNRWRGNHQAHRTVPPEFSLARERPRRAVVVHVVLGVCAVHFLVQFHVVLFLESVEGRRRGLAGRDRRGDGLAQ